jgi:hypothetical protein
VASAALVVVFVAAQGDFVASDPLWYADIAHRIALDAHQAFSTFSNHPFEMRVGLTLPLAGLYRLFGVSTAVSDLPSLFAALTILVVVYTAVDSPRARLLALLFAITCVPLLQEACMLNVDLPCAAAMACSLACLQRHAGAHGRRWLVGAMVWWFAAFLIKETALWLAPAWFAVIAFEWRAHGARSAMLRVAPSLAVGAVLGAVYLMVCAIVWHDALARFRGVEDLAFEHAWSLHGQSAAEWLGRLTWEPPVMFVKMFHLALVASGFGIWRATGPMRVWAAATVAALALFWFGSASVSAYEPLPLLPRMVLPALPGVIVLAAYGVDRGLAAIADARWRRAIVLVIAGVATFRAVHRTAPLVSAAQPEMEIYRTLRAEVDDPRSGGMILVCSDDRLAAINVFYFGFEPPQNLAIYDARDFASRPPPSGAIVRAVTTPSSGAAIDSLGLLPIVWSPMVRLYDAGDGAVLWKHLRQTR